MKFGVLYSIHLPSFSTQFYQVDNLEHEIFQLFSVQHKKININNNLHAYNKYYKDLKEKNVMDFNVRSRVGKNPISLFYLNFYLERRFILDFCDVFARNTG